jgi:cytochrome d ubiquinol oxidase subunit I
MIAVAAGAAWYFCKRGDSPRWFLLLLVGMTFSGWVATLSGWYVTEVGRQPWLVQGGLRAADAVGAVPAGHVGLTLAAYLVTYAFLLVAYIATLFYLARKEMAALPPVGELSTEGRS